MALRNLFAFALLSSGFATANAATELTCVTTSVPAMVRAEGLSEQLGDIVLSCSGGTGSSTVTGSISVYLPVNVTNRLSAGNVIDAVLTSNDGTTGPISTGATPVLTGSGLVTFVNGSFTLSASGTVDLTISKIRGAVADLGVAGNTPIYATLSWSGINQLLLTKATIPVAVPFPGLLASGLSTLVNCHGSPVPASIDVNSLFTAGTAKQPLRITEGFPNAFQPKTSGLDTGLRFLITYTGFPASARLFLPDAVAGSDTAVPTATGLLRDSASPGAYTPGSGTLLLTRILNTDPKGVGGRPAYLPIGLGPGPLFLLGASEVPLTNGSGFAVYEVLDADPNAVEHAEIPTWMGLPPTGGTAAAPGISITVAPVSTVDTATLKDPVPRFVATQPPQDCAIEGDCAAFPQMKVTAPSLEFTAVAGSHMVGDWIRVANTGGGVLPWTAYLTYKAGSGMGWANLVFASGLKGGGAVQVLLSPLSLPPGIYEATVTVDGGYLGILNYPVKLTVTPPVNPNAPQIAAVVHAATWASGPLVPGSLATVWGSHFTGTAVSVTFDTLPATLLYNGEKQINLEVPAQLSGHASAQMIVTADGVNSAPMTVQLTSIAPGIFANGILNQDNSVNSAANAASGGSVIQVFATGLPAADVGTITAKIHDVWITSPDYAGPAPALVGVQQVNLRVPEGWPPMTTSVIVCATSVATATRTCSPEAPFSVK